MNRAPRVCKKSSIAARSWNGSRPPLTAAQAELVKVGRRLSALRLKAAPTLSGAVREQLRDLGFKKSEFQIHLLQLDSPSATGLETIEFVFAPRSTGLETVEFLFAPNPGEPPKPLRSIASSGEISRVMLAVKSALADQDAVPLLVFDEIDANVGGEIAHAVAAKMRSLGERHQVLCITHLPQVAALAAAHYVVTKEFTDERDLFAPGRGQGRRRACARSRGCSAARVNPPRRWPKRCSAANPSAAKRFELCCSHGTPLPCLHWRGIGHGLGVPWLQAQAAATFLKILEVLRQPRRAAPRARGRTPRGSPAPGRPFRSSCPCGPSVRPPRRGCAGRPRRNWSSRP